MRRDQQQVKPAALLAGDVKSESGVVPVVLILVATPRALISV